MKPNLFSGKKVFCVGRNKTGTTSLGAALEILGLKVAPQYLGERLLDSWVKRDFAPIIRLCETAEAFQDIPFSLDYTYVVCDAFFPGSKFVLTIRNDSETWYNSVVRFHSKLLGTYRAPTTDDLRKFGHIRPGWLLKEEKAVYGVDDAHLYDKEIYIRHYEEHNRRVKEYFRYRPEDLLVLNVAETNAMKRLCDFLGLEYRGEKMPHLMSSG